jgi:nitroreductase
MSKPAATEHPVLDAVRERWSPRAFDGQPLDPDALRSLFEAARWSASSFNEQPWRWLLAVRDDSNAFAKMLSCLGEWNQRWARSAGALAMGVARVTYAKNGKPNHHAWYDLGQSSALMAVQAAALGLQIHQMGGIEPARVKEIYGVPDGHEVVVGIAIGRQGDPETLPDEDMLKSERAERKRRALAESVFGGRWEETHRLFAAE